MSNAMVGYIGIIIVFCLGYWFGYVWGEWREFKRMNKALQCTVAENIAYRWLIRQIPLRQFDEMADKAPPNIREHFYSDALLTGKKPETPISDVPITP